MSTVCNYLIASQWIATNFDQGIKKLQNSHPFGS